MLLSIYSNEDMILALAGQFLSNCLMNLKNSGDSTGFEPMTSAMPVQCSKVMGSNPVESPEFFRFMRQLLKNCPASARIISSFDFKHHTSLHTTYLSCPFTIKLSHFIVSI